MGYSLASHPPPRVPFVIFQYEQTESPTVFLGWQPLSADRLSKCNARFWIGQCNQRLAQSESAIAVTHYLQDLFTILRDAISRSPCSELFFFTPADDAASLASSFILCMVTFETVPLAVTV